MLPQQAWRRQRPAHRPLAIGMRPQKSNSNFKIWFHATRMPTCACGPVACVQPASLHTFIHQPDPSLF